MWLNATFPSSGQVYNIVRDRIKGRLIFLHCLYRCLKKGAAIMTDEMKSTIGKNLKSVRWKKGWSQAFVERQTGISIRTISRAETGCGISKSFLKRLCALYQIPMESVYSDTEQKNSISMQVTPIPDDVAVRLLMQSSFVGDIQREAVLRFNDSIQKNAVMYREQVEDILPEVISERKSYTLSDIVQCCLEVNRRTVQNIAKIAIA